MTTHKIAIIIGTNRPKRIGRSIAEWTQQQLQSADLQVDLLDLATIDLPFLDEPEIPAKGDYQQDHTRAWSQLVSQYDGFVLLFPQYNWGYPAVLKNALDYLYREWAHKPVSIMPYGGHGGFQSLIAMKLVTEGLHMQNLATNPQISIAPEMFNAAGQFNDVNQALKDYQPVLQLVATEMRLLVAAHD